MSRDRLLQLVALLCSLAGIVAVTAAIVDSDGDGRPDTITISIGQATAPKGPAATGDDTARIGDPKNPVAQPVTVDTDRQSGDREQQAAQDAENPGVHEDAVDETPSGVDENAIERGLQQTTAPGRGPPQPTGGAQGYSCRYKPVVNQSSRAGQRVLVAPLHYTVSANRPGWGDVNAIWGLFNSRSFAASSTYIMDFEGNCLRLMPESAKPWTQGNFNGRSVSIEIIATGRETRAEWLAAPLFAKGTLAALWRDVLRRNGLPLRQVDPQGCTVQQAGWTDHESLECGNDHHDVKPAFPFDVFQRQLVEGGCDRACERRRSLRTRNVATHRELRSRRCAPRGRTRSDRCKLLHRRHAAVHAAAKREGVRL